MTQPRAPDGGDSLSLPCGEVVSSSDIDLGMREYECTCGSRHAVVTDAHPLGRFVPEFLVETLRETIETEDEFPEFATPHALAMVQEEFPEQVVSMDCSDDGTVGYALLWMSEFDSRRLHEIVVELLIDLMEHAISHAEDGPTVEEFEQHLASFDLEAFVDAYRAERDFEDEFDTAI